MKTMRRLHALGQSIWLDNVTRAVLDDGTIARVFTNFPVTGLESIAALAELKDEGSRSFVESSTDVMTVPVSKSAQLKRRLK